MKRGSESVELCCVIYSCVVVGAFSESEQNTNRKSGPNSETEQSLRQNSRCSFCVFMIGQRHLEIW